MTGLAAAPANAHSNVQIINETQHAIVEGILGRDVLPVGQSVKHHFDDGEELVRSGSMCAASAPTATQRDEIGIHRLTFAMRAHIAAQPRLILDNARTGGVAGIRCH